MPWPNQNWPNQNWPNESLDTSVHTRRNVPTLGEIISEIRVYLQDPNAAIWSDAEIRRKVNRAILKVWLETWFGGGRHQARVKKISDIEEKFLKRPS